MKIIQSTNGSEIIVDDCDFDCFAKFSWRINHYRYAVRQVGSKSQRKCIFLHSQILKPSRGMRVDHRGRNPLNNRRSNLRECTASQNLANRPKPIGMTGFKGVCWSKKARKWMAKITVNYRGIYLGIYSEPRDAVLAYNAAAIKHFGEFAFVNQVALA